MKTYRVALFAPYPFEIGQKLHISAGPRRGDWEVAAVTEKTVRLRCPVSLREFEWHRFCYFVETKQVDTWPQQE